MKRTVCLGLAAAVLAASGLPSLAAQNRSGNPGPAPRARPTTADDIGVLHRYSHCAARRDTIQVRRLLAMDYRSAGYIAALHRLAQRNAECAPPGSLRFGLLLFAGAMAESLVRWRLEGSDLASWTAPVANQPPLAARDETEVMALCTVRAAPAEIATLLATRPASDREAAAIRALMPPIGNCLASGVRATLNRPAIRSVLALAPIAWSNPDMRWRAGVRDGARPVPRLRRHR